MNDCEKTAIYEEYRPKVFGYIHTKLHSVQDAEDLTADVFVKVYSKLDSFDESKSSISTWIYTITRNTVYDYFRTRRVTDELSDTVPEASDFTERVCTELMLEKLAAVMNRISERERDLISLHYLGGLTLKETADRLDISYSYAKRIHADALQELRRLMEK